MFKIGDIVRPKKGFMGHNYCFKIIEVEMNPFDDNTYKLQGIKQDLDPLLGSTSYQVSIIDKVEELWWGEKHIELTSTVKLRYDVPNIKMSDYKGIVLEKMEKEILKLNDKVKEEKEMQILDLYEERKRKAIEKEYAEAKEIARKNGKKSSKPILQIKNGKIVNKFSSGAEASQKTNISHSHLLECCNGKRKTAGGYIWKFNNNERRNDLSESEF